MGSRLTDDYEPVAPYFGDPDDLESRTVAEKEPAGWTELEEQIRLRVVPYCRLKLLNSYVETQRLIERAVRAHQLKNVKNPEFVRK